MVTDFEEIIVSDGQRRKVCVASLQIVSHERGNMIARLTTYLLSRPDPPPISRAATRGVTKRANAISLVIEVYILKVKLKRGTGRQLRIMQDERREQKLEPGADWGEWMGRERRSGSKNENFILGHLALEKPF